jgi:hypothetical protein
MAAGLLTVPSRASVAGPSALATRPVARSMQLLLQFLPARAKIVGFVLGIAGTSFVS